MKPVQLTTMISFCLVIFISFNSFAKKEAIKLQLFKGDQYTYVIAQENTMKESADDTMMYQKMALKIHHAVIDRLNNGNYLIEASFKSFNMELKYQGIVSRYNSDTVNVANKLYKTLNFLTDIKLRYELSPEGVVSKLSGFEPIKKNLQTDTKLPSLLRFFGSEQFVIELYNYVPVSSVGVGDQWTKAGILPDLMDLKYDNHYTFKEASANQLKLNQEASFSFSTESKGSDGKIQPIHEAGTQKGILLLEPNSRLCISSDIDQRLEILMPGAANAEGKKVPPVNLITRTTIHLVKK